MQQGEHSKVLKSLRACEGTCVGVRGCVHTDFSTTSVYLAVQRISYKSTYHGDLEKKFKKKSSVCFPVTISQSTVGRDSRVYVLHNYLKFCHLDTPDTKIITSVIMYSQCVGCVRACVRVCVSTCMHVCVHTNYSLIRAQRRL